MRNSSQITDGIVLLTGVSDDILLRFTEMCDRKSVPMELMFETMVRSFDRGPVVYGLQDRINFGKYSGMVLDDLIRTDTRYMTWLTNTSAWFRLDASADRLLRQMKEC